MLGLGRTKLWELVRRGRLRSLRVGKRVLVPVRELERFLTEAMAEAENGR
jgi:excisionase family DNA binding protein